MKQNSQKGFTLVELAIVLMIIGLLIGGILRGQELLENARVKSTVQQIKSYQGAAITFRDSYSAMPGDLATATSRIPGCIAANFCENGNGNGIIGVPIGPATSVSGNTENTQFWKHLGLTHLITGINPAANPVSAVEWGEAQPAAKIAGGFQYIYMDYGITGDPSRPTWVGDFLRLQLNPVGEIDAGVGASGGTLALTPKRAAQIDRLLDDGEPGTGDVLSFDAGVAPSGARCEMPFPYDEASEILSCDLLIRL